jgi:WD40 repeat protein
MLSLTGMEVFRIRRFPMRLTNRQRGSCLRTKGWSGQPTTGDNWLQPTLAIWQVSDEPKAKIMRGHSRPLSAVAWSPNGKFLASGSRDHTIRIWNVADDSCIHVEGISQLRNTPMYELKHVWASE